MSALVESCRQQLQCGRQHISSVFPNVFARLSPAVDSPAVTADACGDSHGQPDPPSSQAGKQKQDEKKGGGRRKEGLSGGMCPGPSSQFPVSQPGTGNWELEAGNYLMS